MKSPALLYRNQVFTFFFRDICRTFHNHFFIIFSLFSVSVDTDEVANPSFAFGWLDDKDTFEAGDIATIKIKVLGNLKEEGIPSSRNSSFCPALTVNGKIGNSSYISGVSLNVDGDSAYWKICFTPILAGVFNVVISDNHFGVFDSSLHFHVFPGNISKLLPFTLSKF